VPAAFATVLRAADNSRGENDKRRFVGRDFTLDSRLSRKQSFLKTGSFQKLSKLGVIHFMSNERKNRWKKAGEQCPICGSTNTQMRDFHQDIQTIYSIGEPPQLIGRNPRFSMCCSNCGHSEHFQGNPFE
jgi:hypothetical protein